MITPADLLADPATSYPVRVYVDAAIGRDPVDVVNELEVLYDVFEAQLPPHTRPAGYREDVT